MAIDPGALAGLGAALLFGAGAPAAKLLLAQTGPWLLAALLYLGSDLGLALYHTLGRAAPVRSTLAGGAIGPVLLMTGLAAPGRAPRARPRA